MFFAVVLFLSVTYLYLVFNAFFSSFIHLFMTHGFGISFSVHVLLSYFDSCFWVALLRWLLLSLHLFQIVYSVDDTCFLTYCEMVSKQQYEEQKVSSSTEALRNLLHSILIDEKLSEKERKKRIKQVCFLSFFIVIFFISLY